MTDSSLSCRTACETRLLPVLIKTRSHSMRYGMQVNVQKDVAASETARIFPLVVLPNSSTSMAAWTRCRTLPHLGLTSGCAAGPDKGLDRRIGLPKGSKGLLVLVEPDYRGRQRQDVD